MTLKSRRIFFAALSCGLIFVPTSGLQAQQGATQPAATQPQAQPVSSQADEPDPRKRERTDKEKIEAQKAYKGELHGAFKTWLNQDVVWIITEEEEKAFKSLSNDDEREAFIENFWLRRNPNPD